MGEPEEGLITRVYPVLTCMQERKSKADSSREGDGEMSDWKAFFASMGVNWPDGSSVSYVASEGLLRVTNTPENLAVFEQALEDINVCPRMVEVGVQICAFPTEDYERLRLSGDVSVDALLALRKKGRAKPVASATVLTKSGQEAVAKAVREMLYPTELGVDGGSGALTPRSFEMREVGMCLQVVPEIRDMNPSQISLMLGPRWVTLDRWDTFASDQATGWAHKPLPFRQPVFGTTSFQTQATVKDGATVLLGSNSTPDGKWVHAGFLTVRRVDVQAGPADR
jgi:type II secretory pathway component GspD/PulD (secretin)